jgi:uncharacterized membrane protein HdeD (DUF308 family)
MEQETAEYSSAEYSSVEYEVLQVPWWMVVLEGIITVIIGYTCYFHL